MFVSSVTVSVKIGITLYSDKYIKWLWARFSDWSYFKSWYL